MNVLNAIEQHGPAAGNLLDRPALLANITEAFLDGEQTVSAHWPQLSAHPIVLHPIKNSGAGLRWYLPLWTALDLRDTAQEPKLRRWRQVLSQWVALGSEAAERPQHQYW